MVAINSWSQCFVTSFNANISACDPATNTYQTDGTVTFVNPPAGGTLIVEDCNGFQDVFFPPFISPINYLITGETADGAPCDVTVYFSADPGCTMTLNYIAPFCPCNLDFFSVNIGICDPFTDTYPIDGDIQFTSPPVGGTLIVTVDNGTTTYDTIINPPFISPMTYSFTGVVPADGAATTITVYFSTDPGCSQIIAYVAPVSCFCPADIGTFNISYSGGSPNPGVLCWGDSFDFLTNSDYTVPPDVGTAGITYDPGVAWLIYSCPPTIGLIPSSDPLEDVALDPCLEAYVPSMDLSDVNNPGFLGAFPPGTFTDNIIYFVPITMYSIVDGYYSSTLTLWPCYMMGTPIPVQYLPEFTYSIVEDCVTGTATVNVNGGLAEIDGSLLTGGGLLPGGASFVTPSAPDGGNIVAGSLIGGDFYSFDVTDANGCPYSVSGGPFIPSDDPTFSYPSGYSYCQSDPNPLALVTGMAGGTFSYVTVSGGPTLSLNPATGAITTSTSDVGTYDITYNTGSAPASTCPNSMTLTVTILPAPVAVFPDQEVCDGDLLSPPAFSSDIPGSTFTWTNVTGTDVGFGLSGSGNLATFTGVNPGTSPLTVTVQLVATSPSGCIGSPVTFVVTVNPLPSVSFFAVENGCDPVAVTFTNTSTPAGVDCTWDFGDGSTGFGCGVVSHNYDEGIYDVTLTVTTLEGCTASITYPGMIVVDPLPTAFFAASPPVASIDDTEIDFINSSINADTYQWTFGDGSPTSSAFSPSHTYPVAPQECLVELVAYNLDSSCTDTATFLIIIEDIILFYVPNVFTPDGDQFNEMFLPIFISGFDPYNFHLMIFNRWGELIFESFDASKGWDGTYGDRGLVEDGVYVWKITFKESMSDKMHTHYGHVVVLR